MEGDFAVEELPHVRRMLAMVDVLEPLPPEEIGRLASLGSFLTPRAGEELPLEEDGRALYVLADGKMRVYEANPRGEDLTLSVVESGTVLGQTGFVPWRERQLRAEALEPSVVLRLGVAEDRLSDLTRKGVQARLASLLLKLVEYEGVVIGDGSRRLPTRYTHRQLGSMIGANREAVTRALKGLREGGGVQVRRRLIHVVDPDRLRRAAG